jgi:hypothetical protein
MSDTLHCLYCTSDQYLCTTVLNWIMFGSSGHVKRPRGGVANYIKCSKSPDFEINKHIKSIVNTDHVQGQTGAPHHFLYHEGHFAVNTDFQRVDGPFNQPPTWTGWHINHYVTKSKEEYELKMKRGSGDGGARSSDFFESIDESTQDVCLPLVFR